MLNNLQVEILDYLKRMGTYKSPSEVAAKISKNPQNVAAALNELFGKKLLMRVEYHVLPNPQPPGGKPVRPVSTGAPVIRKIRYRYKYNPDKKKELERELTSFSESQQQSYH